MISRDFKEKFDTFRCTLEFVPMDATEVISRDFKEVLQGSFNVFVNILSFF